MVVKKMKAAADKQFKKQLYKTAIISWMLNTVFIPIPLITANIMKEIVSFATSGDLKNLLNRVAWLMGITIGWEFFKAPTGIMFNRLKALSTHKCKMILYIQFLSQPLHRLYNSEHGETIENLNDDFNTIINKKIELVPGLGSAIINAIACFSFISYHSLAIAVILVGISLVQIFPPIIVKRYLQVNYEETRKVEADLTDYIIASYRGFPTIKLYKLKEWYIRNLATIHKKYIKIGSKAEITGSLERTMSSFASNILKYGSYGIIGAMVLWNKASLESGVAAIALSGTFFFAVKAVFDTVPAITVSKVASKRLNAWFEPVTAKNTFSGKDNTIKMKEFSFSYEDKLIFDRVSAEISFNEITIVKGENGIGKSTLLKLICGLIIGYEGELSVAGAIPSEMKENELESNLFYLPQEDAIFDMTLYELYTMLTNQDEKRVRILYNAYRFGLTEETIKKSIIRDLSGGERKKGFLSIALGLDRSLILLDEPTNSLDVAAKEVFCDMIKERRAGAVIITHDDELTELADKILTVGNGGFIYEKVNI